MLWHIKRNWQKKLDHSDENCPSNRPNQNCDYLYIFCPSIPTAGQVITTNQVWQSSMVVVVVVLVVVVVVVIVEVVVVVVVVVVG